ncbi:TatD family hydrolase [Bdellovibrio sp. HCB337]|uniref:TatD family hydrolase n=1 Tax=Bdellovibrio sp. HCB337 TaxID=3394358 RepID=UPI0039A4CE6C
MTKNQWIDAHCHLADERLEAQLDNVISEAEGLGIHFFMQGGVGPEDWQRQRDLAQRYPGKIGLCFGLHPYWVAAHDEDLCEIALDQLAPLLPHALGIGEMGLDFRPHIMKDSRERQIGVFEQQLELAEAVQKPMVLHLVQAHEEALRIMDIWGVPASKGIVHSFNGSWGKAQDFLKRGLYLSIGGPVVWDQNEKLHQVVKDMPLEFLLLESDSPDQPPPRFKQSLNQPASLWDVAGKIGEIRGMPASEILEISTENFKRLFHYDGN